MLILYISTICIVWRGVSFYLVWWVLSRTSKTDNSNSLTLSFLYKPFLSGLWEVNHSIMKRTLLFLMSVIMVLSAYAQKSTSIKTFEYPDYLCPNPYTGKPIYGGNTLEISYSEKKSSYGIEFRYGYVKYSLSLSYKGMDNGRYVYTGFEIGNMTKATVMTSTKLSRFLDNYGQMQSETFEKDKLIGLHISGSGSLSVYPIKDTPERRKRIEEKVAKQEVENTARNKLEELYPYGVQYLQDSLKQQVVKEFFGSAGEVKSFNLQPHSFHTYIAVIDTNKQVTVIQKDEVVLNAELQNEQLHAKIEYEASSTSGKTAKVVNGKVFFSMTFHPKLKIKEHECSVLYGKKENSYLYFKYPYRSSLWNDSSQIEAPKEIRKIVEDNIVKKGKYSLYWKTIDEKLVSLSYVKHGLVDTVPIEVYSIYK